MKLLSALVSALAVAAFGFAGGLFGLALIAPERPAFAPPQRLARLEVAPEIGQDLPTGWPAVFGEIAAVAPEPEPEPEPEVVEEPPEENTTYWLTGLVAGRGSDSWAMISENDRGLVVRVGDELIGGEIVTAIDAKGVWIDDDGERQLIPVQKADLGELATVEQDPPLDLPQARLLAEVVIPMEDASRDFVERALQSAGELAVAEGFAARGMELVQVQRGELFDQMGLRAGDTILSINGKALQTQDLIADIPGADLRGKALQMEILRDGARQMLKVTLDQG